MSRFPGDDFFNAMSGYAPANSSSPSQSSDQSASQYPVFQSGYMPQPPMTHQPGFPGDYQQFQQYQQWQQWQQSQQQQYQQSQPNPPPRFQAEPEPQTQTEGSRRRKKDKQQVTEGGKKTVTKTPWTIQHLTLLTECFIDVSEDPRRGNSQSQDAFWSRVQEKFNDRSDIPRTKDQLSSKWRAIRLDVGKFVAIYSGYAQNRRSGEDDLQVMEQSRKAYLLDTGKSFNLYECFVILKEKPKFLASTPVDVMGRSLSKRKPYINLDEDEEEDENVNLGDPTAEPELFGQDRLERPVGRNKSQRHSGSSDATSSRSSSAELQATLDRLGHKRTEVLETKKTALEVIIEEEKKRTMFAALSMLETGTTTEEQRRFVQKAKKSVMNEYKHLVADSDDED